MSDAVLSTKLADLISRANAAPIAAVPALAPVPMPPIGARRYGTDAADFLAVIDEDDDPYIVQGLIPEGMPTMIVGSPKARKSWIMVYLAVTIAMGIPAFGRKTRRGRVLMIAREDTAKETRRRAKLVIRALGIEPEQLRGWLRIDSSQPLYFDKLEDVDALGETLDEFGPSVVFVDSLSRVHSKDENSKAEMAIVMNVWSDLCTKCSCSVVLLHHVVKWSDGGTLIQRIRGSGDIGAVLRAAIGVEKTGDDTSKLETDGNLADLAPEFSIRFADLDERGAPIAAGDPMAAKKRNRVSITMVGTESDETPSDPISDPLVGELADVLMDGPTTVTKLRKGRGGKKAVDAALELMVERHLIVPVMKGRKHEGYKLTEHGSAFATGRPTFVVRHPAGIAAAALPQLGVSPKS